MAVSRSPGLPISTVSRRLRTTPRMLRYRETLGLLPATNDGVRHRRFHDDDLAAAALAIRLEERYDVSPRTLAFALRVLAEPRVTADVRELAERTGRITPPATRALDFDQQKAMGLLRRRPAPPSPTGFRRS